MRRGFTLAVLCGILLHTGETTARVYQRTPGDLLHPQWLNLHGWKEAESRQTILNGIEHQTHLWQVEKPLSLVFQEIQRLYRQSQHPGHFSLGDFMGWGKVSQGDVHHHYLLFSLHSPNRTLVMRLESVQSDSTIPNHQFDLIPPGATRMRSILQPESQTELVQARSHQSAEYLSTFYDNRFRADGWEKGLGGLYLKNGKMRMVHLLSTGQGSEVQISILTADQNPQMEKNP